MTTHKEQTQTVNGQPVRVPRPATLAPDASLGEVISEIDQARHDVARTVSALVERFTPTAQARRKVHSSLQALRWDSRRVRQDVRAAGTEATNAIPPGVSDVAHTSAQLFRKSPKWLTIGLPALLVLRLVVKRLRQHN